MNSVAARPSLKRKASAITTKSSRIILHVDLDCFFAQAAVLEQPALRAKPVVVHQHGDVITVNYEGIPRKCHLSTPLMQGCFVSSLCACLANQLDLWPFDTARLLGVRKHDTVEHVMRHFPSVAIIHVPLGHGSKVTYVPYQNLSDQVCKHGSSISVIILLIS